MPRNDGPHPENPPHDAFEEELGTVLRRTGDGFAADDRRELVEGGLRRGRRRLARRRLAVTGSALALVAMAAGGVYGGLFFGPTGAVDTASVAAPPKPTSATEPTGPLPDTARIPVKEAAAVLKAHTPAGRWTIDNENGLGQGVLGVYDDGNGKAAVTVLLSRSYGPGEAGEGMVTCPDKAHVPDAECTTEKLPGVGRLMLLQGYEYPDRREDTKDWRATLLTEDGFIVDVNEYNAAAEKGAPVSRENPPFTLAQLKALVTADAWRPLLAKLPEPSQPGTPPSAPDEPSGEAVRATLLSLLPKGLKAEGKGGRDDYGYVSLLVDDGKGRSFVEVNVQTGMDDVADHLRAVGATTLPDGRLVGVTREAAEKGGDGVVARTVDTLTPEGFRVVITTLNSDGYRAPATRAEPALTVEQLKAIALSPKWQKLIK